MDKTKDLITFSDIAIMLLESKGYTPELCSSEEEAKEKANHLKSDSKAWPCYFFTSDTTGEKSFEEFYTSFDKIDFNRFDNIGVIKQPVFKEYQKINQALKAFEKIKKMDRWLKKDIVKAIKIIVPELIHEEKYKNLDQKM